MASKRLDSNAEMLEILMQKALDAYDMDVDEVDEILENIKTAMGTSKMALEQYAQALNETLRTKAQVRDRLLKLIGMLAQRVRVNEVAAKGQDGSFVTLTPEETLAYIEDIQAKKAESDKNKKRKDS